MALPQDGQNANGLTKVTEIPKGKELIFIDPTTNEGGIITLEDLTTQILKNLTSQTFALDQGTMTLLQALNQLNSKARTVVNTEYLKADTNFCNIRDGLYSFNINSTNTAPAEYKQPPKSIGDGIIIVKTYSIYQTMCCIGFKGVAVAQKNIKTNEIEIGWNILCTKQ